MEPPSWSGAPTAALHESRPAHGRLPGRRGALSLTLCLGIGLLLALPATAWGISGYAGGQTAAAAQYPDAAATQSTGPKSDISNLAQVMRAIRNARLVAPGQWQANQRAVVHRELQALSTGAGAGLRQTGSIALLIAAIAVILVGGVLRWRRGEVRTE